MEHNLQMCQSMCNTRCGLQSSTVLFAATKTRASPNQLNNFIASAESHIMQPTTPYLQFLCLHDLNSPPRIYINWLFYLLRGGFPTLIYVQPSPPPINVWTPTLPPLMFLLFYKPAFITPLFHVSIVFISLTPALSTVFILTYLSTRSIVHAISLIVT